MALARVAFAKSLKIIVVLLPFKSKMAALLSVSCCLKTTNCPAKTTKKLVFLYKVSDFGYLLVMFSIKGEE